MKKILKVIIVLVMITIQFFVLDPSYFRKKIFSRNVPVEEKGKIDLSQWDFVKNGAIRLNGEWEYYDNQILMPEDFREGSNKKPELTGYTKLSSTGKREINGRNIPPKGTGTYRLTIKINPSDQIFGMKIGNIRMSNRVYINGILKGSSGNPAEKDKGYYPGNTPYSTYFNISGDKIEVILQTANFDYLYGGILHKIHFGLQKDINFITIAILSAELTGAMLVLLFGIYHLSIYFMRNEDKSFLYSGIYFLIFSVTLLVNGERAILQFFPSIPFNLICRVQQTVNALTIIPLAGIIKGIDEKILPDLIVKVANIVSIPYIVIPLIAPYSIYSHLNLSMSILNIVFIIMIIFRLIIMYLENSYGALDRKGILLLLKSIICLGICLGNNYLYFFNIIHSNIVGSIGGFGFIIFTADTLAYNFVKTYETMEKMSEELIKMDKTKDEFITKTSYELKAPLYGIINIAETIIKENSNHLKEKNIKDIIIIKNIALRLSNIVDDILDVTLLKNGQLKVNISLVDIKVCTNIVIEAFKYMMQNKNIEIINNIKESIMVKADENRVRQILFNLINNSIASMDEGIIKIGSNRVNNMIYISVEDTGCGIPRDKQKSIFEPYEFLDSEGASLGLYISRQLVELMEGQIYLDWSETNKGSRFVFSIPYWEGKSNLCRVANREELKYFHTSASRDHSEADNEKAYESTILIVDDEIFNIQTALNILGREGYNVLVALSGEEVLEKIQDNKVDLILLDIMMPRISGIDVCRKIREKYSVIELPILISTLGNTNYDLFLGFEAGANDFITKPFEEKEIRARVRTLITLKKSMEDVLKNELAFLQAQIKPHFLYNVISTIIYFCYTDSKKAAELLTDFSRYLRLAFDIDNKLMIIPLSRELQLVDAYVQIEKARFGDKIKIEYDIEEEIMDEKIPSLSIQPLIENAVKHGICKKKEGGTIYLSVKRRKELIYIVVRDTGVGMPADKVESLKNIEDKNNGIGFSNIGRRIRRLTKADIDIYSIEGEGTTVAISIKNL